MSIRHIVWGISIVHVFSLWIIITCDPGIVTTLGWVLLGASVGGNAVLIGEGIAKREES